MSGDTARCGFLTVGRRGERCGRPARWTHELKGWPPIFRCAEHEPPTRAQRDGTWRPVLVEDPA